MKGPEFAPRVSLGDIVTGVVAILAAAGFAWSTQAEVRVQAQRIDALESVRESDERNHERDDAKLEASLREIKDSMRRLEDKVDRIAEKDRRL
jgi:hypothetical protein